VDAYPGPLFCFTGLYIFLCQYHAVSIAMSLHNSLKSGTVIPPALLLC
jgi:hypothetical protein